MKPAKKRTVTNRYAYRREDNEQIIWVDFDAMMDQRDGFITLADGTEARRCTHLENHKRHDRCEVIPSGIPTPAVSDALGFPDIALADRKKQLQEFGCRDIEFKRDPQCPEFYQVHGASRKALEDYGKRRNMFNKTGSLGGKVILSKEDFERARELVSRSPSHSLSVDAKAKP